MAERTSYTPGTFCWTDLTTPDQEAAKAFYSPLFGWEAFDAPVGDGVYYSMMSIDGKQVGAAVAWAMRVLIDDLRRRQRAAGTSGKEET